MVLVKMLMKIGPPMMRGLLVMTMASISPSRREVSPAESLRRRAKVLLPKFRLETMVFRPESPLPYFSRSKDLMYQKMGTEGGLGCPPPTRARLGGLAGPMSCGHQTTPSGSYLLQYLLYISK
jgi:hypothetical protein